jgi:hypothetical protein
MAHHSTTQDVNLNAILIINGINSNITLSPKGRNPQVNSMMRVHFEINCHHGPTFKMAENQSITSIIGIRYPVSSVRCISLISQSISRVAENPTFSLIRLIFVGPILESCKKLSPTDRRQIPIQTLIHKSTTYQCLRSSHCGSWASINAMWVCDSQSITIICQHSK